MPEKCRAPIDRNVPGPMGFFSTRQTRGVDCVRVQPHRDSLTLGMQSSFGISRRQALCKGAIQLAALGTVPAALSQPADPLVDSSWVERLSRPDHLMLMRHALAPGVGDPSDFKHGKCHTQRNLNEQGRDQARVIGTWLKSRGVHTAQVFSSPWCRCVDTAQGLGLGPVMVESALGSFFGTPQQRQTQTRSLEAFVIKALARKKTAALILVSHHVNIEAYSGQVLNSGEMLVAQVDSNGHPIQTERIYGL